VTRSEHIGLALLVLASAITVLAHPFPPTNDASSHLATAVAFRGVLLDDPAVTAWYAFDATPLPYWLPTLLMQPLLALFEPLLAWRILMVAYLVALPLSWSFLLRTAAPQSAPLALLGALCAFNWAYWLGEAAFLLGLPLTLVSYALYLGLERTRSRRFVVFLLAALATYLSHVFALAALFGAVGLHLLLRRGGAARAQWVAAALLALAASVAVYLVMGSHGTDANHGELVFAFDAWRAGAVVRFPLGMSFASPLPAVALVLFVAALPGRRPLCWPLLAPGLALCALAYAGPSGIQEPTGFEDIGQRFTLWGLLLTLGGLGAPSAPRRRAALLAVFLLYGAASIVGAWREHAAYQGPAERLAAMLPQGSKLLPLQAGPPPPPASRAERLHRFGNHVVTLRRGYGPHLFARAGQQPMRHLRWPDYRRVRDLRITTDEWAFYDHVLVQTETEDPRVPGLEARAERIASTDGFQLWQLED